ncbi:MAG: tetratricopeptide repeat protein [Planctomycetota bacterium]
MSGPEKAQASATTAGAAALVALALLSPLSSRAHEVHLSSRDFEGLDTFEGHRVSRADKSFNKRDYRRAAAEYDMFLKEFPKSKAAPYAILRKGRCLELGNKRYKAVKVYNEVLDYFPNDVTFAAPALYYIGECHRNNGDEAKAMKAWAEMADDIDYSKHFLAASAVNSLADNLVKQGKAAEAAKYYRQVAIDFGRTNPGAAGQAAEKVVFHHVRTAPNEEKLRKFWEEARIFGGKRRKGKSGSAEDRPYWDRVRGSVRKYGRFSKEEDALKTRYYSYWVSRLEGKFPESDAYQKDLADLHLAATGDRRKWTARLDAQFEKYQNPGDYGRVLKWMGYYRGNRPKTLEYYGKFNFAEMPNRAIRSVMDALSSGGHEDMARNTFSKLRISEMNDKEKVSLMRVVWRYGDLDLLETLSRSLKDRELGRMELLRYHHWRKDLKRGLPLTKELASSPRFATEVIWLRAELYDSNGKYVEAIKAYQQADRPPENLWRIADCYAKLKKLSEAVQQLREVEAFFKNLAPEAVMRIAQLYKRFRKRPEHIAALREIMKKYPKSGQSRQAHVALEALGVRIGGAVDAEH